MATKRVHFALEPARTPSPSFSASSFDSPEPRTPPSLPPPLPHQSPYGYSKPFPPSPSGLQVNPLVAASSHAGASQRPFLWDLRVRPSDITPHRPSAYDPAYPIPAASLALPATTPPAHRLEIRCEHLPWRITVTPSQRYNNIYVTVGDIMGELYNALRLQISREEFAMACGTNAEYKHHVEAAYERRVLRSASPGQERVKGIRRVDLLLYSTIFAGFAGIAGDNTSLMLCVHES
ncbi:hypothetical protein BDW22DRAFT_1339405 [Trametopsis cervina]|nr:hypothetical protein BDW22DRAFT_1339405 [Trametopsis cervina]